MPAVSRCTQCGAFVGPEVAHCPSCGGVIYARPLAGVKTVSSFAVLVRVLIVILAPLTALLSLFGVLIVPGATASERLVYVVIAFGLLAVAYDALRKLKRRAP